MPTGDTVEVWFCQPGWSAEPGITWSVIAGEHALTIVDTGDAEDAGRSRGVECERGPLGIGHGQGPPGPLDCVGLVDRDFLDPEPPVCLVAEIQVDFEDEGHGRAWTAEWIRHIHRMRVGR